MQLSPSCITWTFSSALSLSPFHDCHYCLSDLPSLLRPFATANTIFICFNCHHNFHLWCSTMTYRKSRPPSISLPLLLSPLSTVSFTVTVPVTNGIHLYHHHHHHHELLKLIICHLYCHRNSVDYVFVTISVPWHLTIGDNITATFTYMV